MSAIAGSLQVTIPNDAWIGEQRSEFADVTISYKFVPDDPVERACRAHLRSGSIDEQQKWGPAYVAKCRAEGGAKSSPR
jgi:hypothetical protein